MEYKIISTGSKGNAVVVDGRILIDCGVPFRRLESVYRDLDAVLLTHIHSDHFQPKTLARLAAERPSLRFFACPWLGPDLQNAGVPLRQITITTPDRWYDTGYCFVKACETKHNVRNCCWHIWFNDGSKVFYATDMGNLNGITAPYYDLYLVEANYRDEEIQAKIAEKKVNGEYIYEKRVLRDHMRKPPDFAIMYSPYLHYPGEMNYQTFCGKAFADGIQLVGLRTAESLTRLKCIANAKMERIVRGGKFYPIYDWRDSDVWLYIKQRDLEFPEIYMRLYEAGVRKNALRLCAFFGDCSTQGLRWVAETDADLWDRIQKREPNAYLVLLYWDSEMFRRSTKKRRDLEAGTEKKDYKALCKDILFLHPEKYTIAKDTKAHLDMWRGMFIKTYGIAMDKHYKTMYEGLLYGDPKMRVLRILWTEIYNDHNMMIKEAQRGKQQH